MIEDDIASVLMCHDDIALTAHVSPDGDSIGSMLGLYSFLKSISKSVDAYSSDPPPEVFSFLPGYGAIKRSCDTISKKYQVLVVLDCGSIDRSGECVCLREQSDMIINIDHHLTNSRFADISLIDSGASSTGELVYRIIKSSGFSITEDVACCLYTAILTDTGNFRYSNTTSLTHRIAGELIDTGIDFGHIYEMIYNNYKYQDIVLMSRAMSSISLYCGGKVAFMYLLQSDLDGLSFEDINTSDYINYARDIGGVEAAAFAKGTAAAEFRVSFRSKNDVDVRAICEKFGGGGHAKAAGCTMKGSLEEVRNLIINELENALKGEKI